MVHRHKSVVSPLPVIMGNTPTPRLVFIDNLRVFLTMLVVAHHAGQPYGPTGGAWPIFNPERAAILGPFFAVNAAFFMGLFFLISGYLLPAAYDRKGPRQFLIARFQRLGLPLLFFSLAVFPWVLYRLTAQSGSFWAFVVQAYVRPLTIEVAHLWFLAHLLFYAVCYTLWRQAGGERKLLATVSLRRLCAPGHGAILTYLLSLTVVTFMVRINYPIDRWVRLFGCLPTEVAHLPQYLSLLGVGIVAYRYSWLSQISRAQGFTWLRVGLGAALLRYTYSLGGERLFLVDILAGGGWDWRSAVWSGWEATICVGLCLGLLILFREKVCFQGKFMQILSNNAYSVYLIHILIILYLQFAMADLSMAPLAKFGLVTLLGIPLCFGCSALLRRLPFVRMVVP